MFEVGPKVPADIKGRLVLCQAVYELQMEHDGSVLELRRGGLAVPAGR